MTELNSPEERIKLLKAGVDGKVIEKLWIECNNFKIIPKVLKLTGMT